MAMGVEWSEAAIVKALRTDARRRKRPLASLDWVRGTTRRPCARTVHARFGSWRKALEAADLPTGRARREKPWTVEEISAALRAWRDVHGGRWPNSADWSAAGVDRPTTATVKRLCGGWRRAINLAAMTTVTT
jgi:hypothetical protein